MATFLGGLLGLAFPPALAWPPALAFAVVWLAVAWATRYSSAAALAATVVSPLVALATGLDDAALARPLCGAATAA